jgi:hypothetical protein
MEDLVSREEIKKLTNIGQSQFKAFRRHGLIDGHVKRVCVVKLDEKKTRQKGKEVFTPSGFSYLYPRTVLSQIAWVLEERRRGKNLMEIQNEFIRKRIQEAEELRRHARNYEKIVTVPVASSDAPGFRKKLIENAVTTLTQLIKQDNADRNLRRLVFVVEPEKDRGPRDFNVNLSVRLDVDNSDF